MRIANALMRALLAMFAFLGTYLCLLFILIFLDSALTSALHLQGVPWSGAVTILIHGCSVGVAVLVAWQAWKRSAGWNSGRRLAVLAITALPVLALLGFFGYGLWVWSSTYYYIDSDQSTVSKDKVNERLDAWVGITLPQGVDRFHAVMAGGIDPVMFLAFEAVPEQVEEFQKGVLSNCSLTESDAKVDEPPGWVLGMIEKTWWTPRADNNWWYGSGLERARVFLQVDSSKGRVLIAIVCG